MNGSSLHIEHQCPQCGAPVTLLETDRILSCPFCRVSLMIQSDQPLSYTLPLPEGAMNGDDLVFAPYWRFKGIVYALNDLEVTHRIVDLTTRASSFDSLPYTLGMRPQTLKLRLSIARPPSRAFAMSLDRKQLRARLKTGERDIGASNRFSYEAAVGEVVSLLFAPYLLRGEVFHDPFTGRPLPNGPTCKADLDLAEMKSVGDVRFLPTICPQCGWDMEGASDTHVLRCRSCQTLWEAVGKGFHRLDSFCAQSKETVDLWLPFWRIEMTTTGFDLVSYEDFVRLTNIPRMIRPFMASQPFGFWIPAFKIQPRYFLRLSGALTIAQPSFIPFELPETSSLHPCTLSAVEGFHSVPVILGAIAPAKRDLLPKINKGKFAFQGKQLVWAPFQMRGSECIQPRMELCFPRDSLRWGRSL